MRRLLALGLIAPALLVAACGDDGDAGDKGGTTPAPAPKPATAPPSASPTGLTGQQRTGTVTQNKVIPLEGGGTEMPEVGFFMLSQDGGEPLRVGVSTDLAMNRAVKAKLVDPKCSGKLVAKASIVPAPPTNQFDWELLNATLTRDDC